MNRKLTTHLFSTTHSKGTMTVLWLTGSATCKRAEEEQQLNFIFASVFLTQLHLHWSRAHLIIWPREDFGQCASRPKCTWKSWVNNEDYLPHGKLFAISPPLLVIVQSRKVMLDEWRPEVVWQHLPVPPAMLAQQVIAVIQSLGQRWISLTHEQHIGP